MKSRLKAHIEAVVDRYADVVDTWDVVNEVLSDDKTKQYRDGSEGSRWYELFGSEEYIYWAFKYAKDALEAIRKFRSASGGEMPLIGVGGIATADDAWQRIRAGASLVQLYSAMVYEGPHIALRIARGLAERLKREGFANIAELVGTER